MNVLERSRRRWLAGALAMLVCLCFAVVFAHNVIESRRVTSTIINKGSRVSWSIFGHIREIHLHWSCVDEDLKCLTSLPALKKLTLDSTRISDEGLMHVGAIRSLEYLQIEGCRMVTDAGVGHLKGLVNLVELHVTGNVQIDNDAIASLGEMKNLTFLCLRDTGISDNGLTPLANHRHLRHIIIQGTKMTSDGVSQLIREMPQLEFVDGHRVKR